MVTVHQMWLLHAYVCGGPVFVAKDECSSEAHFVVCKFACYKIILEF